MCSSRKNPYPPHGRSLEIPKGKVVLKVRILEAKYEAKLEFPGGIGGCKTKNLPWEEYGYFLEPHIICPQMVSHGARMVIEQGVWVGRIMKENGHEPNGKKVDRNCDKMHINS